MSNMTIKCLGNKKAEVSATFKKRAVIFGTPEYKLWREFLQDNPDYEMQVKTMKKRSKSDEDETKEKETTRNMTYANMKKYISTLDNSEEFLVEFKKQRERSKLQINPYRYVLEWFKATFKDYQKHDAFTSISQAISFMRHSALICLFPRSRCQSASHFSHSKQCLMSSMFTVKKETCKKTFSVSDCIFPSFPN